MALGVKTGGRVKGSLNKATRDVHERLAALHCDPIEGMALIAVDPGASLDLRGRMYAELAQYVAPKRRAIEHTGGIETTFVVRLPDQMTTVEDWQQLHLVKGAA